MIASVREISEGSAERWPAPPGGAAFDGLAGEIVATIEPYSEADPAALLVQMLAAFGCAVGRRPHAMVGATRHGTNLFATVVGRSAKSRKGDSWTPNERLFSIADPEWVSTRIKSGLSSGEGLVKQVRDAVEKDDDPGEADKRLLVVEPEFARVLKMASREGNVLSTTLRDAWDGRNLGSLTKSSEMRATTPHISLIAHVTAEELRRELTATEAANGFANRFLFVAARRAQLLPSPPRFAGPEIDRLGGKIRERLYAASQVDWIFRTPEAEELWDSSYRTELAEEGYGLVGALTARSEAQVLRLSMVYALLDGSKVVRPEHVLSALAVWRYSAASVHHFFGDSLGNAVADRILEQLRLASLTRTEISGLFSRHQDAIRIEGALNELERAGLAVKRLVETSGRPREEWSAT